MVHMMKNKSTIAKLLAEEDVFVVEKQMKTAYFNVKTRELGLPIWKTDVSPYIKELMICHETGHGLWTSLDMLNRANERKLNSGFVNVLEDARIDKFVKIKYPGSVALYNRGYKELAEMDFFGTEGKDINSFNFIDRINLHFKGQKGIVFSDEEIPYVKRVAELRTEDEVLDLAEELYKYMEENPETDNHNDGSDENDSDDFDDTMESNPSAGDESDDDSDNESDDESTSNSTDKSDDESEEKTTGESSTDKSDDESDGVGENEETKPSSTEGGKNSDSKSGPPEATTDNAYNDNLDSLRDETVGERLYARIPKIDVEKKLIVPYKNILEDLRKNYIEERKRVSLYEEESGVSSYFDTTFSEVITFKNESKPTIAYMVKEFEMRKSADQYARASVSKTGALDMNRLHTYKFNDDLFKKVTTLPGATNHGMVMILDWSGSMHRNIKETVEQLLQLVMFCRRTNIPFEVFAFSDVYARNSLSARNHLELSDKILGRPGDIAITDLRLLNFFSSKMTANEETNMMHYLWMMVGTTKRNKYRSDNGVVAYDWPYTYSLGGTPLDETIVAMMSYIPKFVKDNSVQKINTIFLTDGASHRLEGVVDINHVGDPCINREFGNHYSHGKKVLIDPITNVKMEVNRSYTDILYKMLKKRVAGMNLVGFFLAGCNGKISKNTLQYALGVERYSFRTNWEEVSEKMKTARKILKRDKVIVASHVGLDEYYILPGAESVENDSNLDDELIGATKGKLTTAFKKSSKGRVQSRVLLNKFVKMVA